MPKLHAIVENLDDVSDALQELYAEEKDNDGNVRYVLQLHDDVREHPAIGALQRAHESQKQQTREFKEQLAELQKKTENVPEDFDIDRWEQLLSVEKDLKELKDKGELDDEGKKAHEAEIASFKKTHEQQVERLQKKMEESIQLRDETIASLKSRVNKMVKEDGLSRLLAENGVKKEFLPFVQARLEHSAKVADDEHGNPTLVFETDLGEVPATEYIPKWVTDDVAKPFIEQQTGGGALGGKGKGTFSDTNPWSAEHWSMSQQAGILSKDPGKADRMARAAGHVKASGALKMDAK